jgi:hypothetical protein
LRGTPALPGMSVSYVYTLNGVVLSEDYNGGVNKCEYDKRLKRALFALMQPFGFSKADVDNWSGQEVQTTLKHIPK